jgi:parallel beta-helix repeat protein
MHARRVQFRLVKVLAIGVFCSLFACSGGGCRAASEVDLSPTVVKVSLNPVGQVNSSASGTQLFRATVTGSANTGVIWSVDGVTSGNATAGTITGSGNEVQYHAPAVAGTHTITATSASDPRSSDSFALAVPAETRVSPPTSSIVANIKKAPYYAKGDGQTDDTAAIQSAINAIAGTGGTVVVPDGTYMINTHYNGSFGLRLGSKMTFAMASSAVLQAIANDYDNYSILTAGSVSDVTISGGTITGDRSAHKGTTGEYGMGIYIGNSSNITVAGVLVNECWGDGIYVENQSSNITVTNCVCDHNRRQGMSIVSVDGMTVTGSTFKNTEGTPPEMGIDVENNRGLVVNNLRISGCTFLNNAGGGATFGFRDDFSAPTAITNTVFDSNTVVGNGTNRYSDSIMAGIFVGHDNGSVTISNNNVSNSFGQGINISDMAFYSIVRGNMVTGTRIVTGAPANKTGGGIYVYDAPGTRVTGNTVTGNATALPGGNPGIWLMKSDSTVTISGNSVSGNGRSSLQSFTGSKAGSAK